MQKKPSSGTAWAKARYLDASAIVRLYAEGDEQLQEFFNSNPKPFYTTPLCFAEALSVIKRKWDKKQIDTDKYYSITRKLVIDCWLREHIDLEDIGFDDPIMLYRVQKMAKKYNLDLSDALQLITLKQGQFSSSGPNSASVLITADKDLASAAQSEGIRVWNCTTYPAPEWA